MAWQRERDASIVSVGGAQRMPRAGLNVSRVSGCSCPSRLQAPAVAGRNDKIGAVHTPPRERHRAGRFPGRQWRAALIRARRRLRMPPLAAAASLPPEGH